MQNTLIQSSDMVLKGPLIYYVTGGGSGIKTEHDFMLEILRIQSSKWWKLFCICLDNKELVSNSGTCNNLCVPSHPSLKSPW